MKKILLFICLLLFAGVAEADQVFDSYSETNYNNYYTADAVGEGSGQNITASGNHQLTNATFYLYAVTPTLGFKYKLYDCSTSVPTGVALAETAENDGSMITGGMTLLKLDFVTPYTLTDGNDYAIVCELTSYTAGSLRIGHDRITLGHPGNIVYNFGSWSAGSYDAIFYAYEPSVTGVPNVTSYGPTENIYPEVYDSQTFNVTTNQSTSCYWYVNGTLVETDSENTEHSYTNSSLTGGGCNVTADVGNANGNDTQTWLFEVGVDSIDTIILYSDVTNLSCLLRWNVTRIGSNITSWNISYSNTTARYTYYLKYDNGTEITNQEATSDEETLWFNSTTLLPEGIYYLSSESGSESFINPPFTTEEGAVVAAAGAAVIAVGGWLNKRRKRWK